eukprot:gb/GEZN01001860.1/.p1 GENE.gb/GEZN01001860.1/~~gb/GEZN01001860.1/.p1  ORF type:complete len:738 (-),score=113.89 gb/GEZN01001860.1/:565-2730(-)
MWARGGQSLLQFPQHASPSQRLFCRAASLSSRAGRHSVDRGLQAQRQRLGNKMGGQKLFQVHISAATTGLTTKIILAGFGVCCLSVSGMSLLSAEAHVTHPSPPEIAPGHAHKGKVLQNTEAEVEVLLLPSVLPHPADHSSDDVSALPNITVADCALNGTAELLGLLSGLVCIAALAWVGVALPKAVAEIIDRNKGGGSGFALPTVIRMATLFSLEAGLGLAGWALISWTCECFAQRLREAVYGKLLRLDIEFFDMHKVGSLVNSLDTDVTLVRQAVKHFLGSGLKNCFSLVAGLVSLFLISPKLTGIMLIMVPGMVGVGTLVARQLRRLQREIHHAQGETLSEASEGLTNVRTVRAFGNEDYQTTKFAQTAHAQSVGERKYQLSITLFHCMHKIAVNALILTVVWYGGTLVGQGELSSGTLTAFLMHTMKLQYSLARLSELLAKLHKGFSAATRLDELLLCRVAIPVKGGCKMVLGAGEVHFKDVTFAYPARPHVRVLDGINLTLPGGQVTALVGESGSGKSTVAALLERFYDPQDGVVTLDQQDVRALDPTWLRSKCIGLVDQEPVLFSGSIADNIRYGRPYATEQEVEEAAKAANCHTFITALPQGYHTPVGERGVALSGGQKQRIAIARGLLVDPAVLILDEATSALDAESERLVQDALGKLMQGRTTLIIAHRLSTVQDANQILVMRRGQVVERGTHQDLVNKGGVYANLVSAQLY